MALITYADAVRHLKQEGVLDLGSPVDENPDVRLKMEQATAHVLIFLQRPGEWDLNTTPADDHEFGIVQSAVLDVLAWLYRYRGDDDNRPGIETILNLERLGMLKDRVIA